MVWRYEQKQADTWDQTAWIAAHIPNFSKKEKRWEDFNPIAKEKAKKEAAEAIMRVDEIIASGLLPHALTQEETDAAWQAYLEKSKHGQRR